MLFRSFTGDTSVVNIGSGQVYKDVSGNVGIGTATPGYKLDVNGIANASNWQIGGNATGAAGSVGFLNSNGPTVQFYGSTSAGAGVMTFVTAGSERARIDASGNVGIGTGSPSSKLTVAGTIQSTTGGVKFPDGTTQTTAATGGGVTSLTAGNGITVSASTGAVTVNQDIYTGSSATNTSYPIGTVIAIDYSGGSLPNIAATVTPYVQTSASNSGFRGSTDRKSTRLNSSHT